MHLAVSIVDSYISRKTSEIWGTRPCDGTRASAAESVGDGWDLHITHDLQMAAPVRERPFLILHLSVESYCSSSTLRATNTGFPVFGFFSTRPTTRIEMAELPLRSLRPVRPPSQLVTGVV